MKKREKQKAERREQILYCGLDMLVSYGYEATKIRDIAKKLGISTGLFFNYFESKEKLYEELVRIGLSGPESVLKLSVGDIAPIQVFEKMTEAIFCSLASHSITAKMFLLMAQAVNTASTPESVKKLVAGLDAITPVIAIIEKGQQCKEIKQGNPRALAMAYWGAICGIAESFAVHRELPLPQSSWIVDILRA